MTRTEIQQKAVELYKNNSHLLLQWCTGLGKTKAAIDIIKYTQSTLNRRAFILLVVAEIAHKKNWGEEFDKWELDPLKTSIVTVTYASLKNYKEETFDLVILDEAHHAGSELRLEILNSINAGKVLALSATMPINTQNNLGAIFNNIFTDYNISLQEAINWGILPQPQLFLIPMELDNENITQECIKEWGTKSKRVTIQCDVNTKWDYLKNKSKYPHVKLIIKCTELQKYLHLTSEADYYKILYFRTRNVGIKNKWLQLGSERKRYLGNLKDDKAKEVLSLLKGKRYVCFCTSIEQAENLGKENAIHSQKKESLDIIDSFNKKEINSLYAIGMIQEGQNLVDIEAGVIVQLDGQERAFVQKSGRAMRAEEPIIFILYYKDTRDEEYLNKAIEDINPDYIRHIYNLNELEL